VSRLYAADHLPAATWMEQRRAAPKLRLLLIVDPSSNLPGAVREGERIEKLAGGISDVDVTPLRQKEATRDAILDALRSGLYDCIHYAGHAFFDEAAPGRSGLICAGDEILAGADLRGIGNLPYLVFFNACEGARIRGARATSPEKTATEVVLMTSGVAESLMRGGIANYLSTYWPVSDDAAMTFAETFYTKLLQGQTLGSSVLSGRKALNEKGQRDWADYVLSGTHDFVLKHPANES
jgi:CHAT domain-containing protein